MNSVRAVTSMLPSKASLCAEHSKPQLHWLIHKQHQLLVFGSQDLHFNVYFSLKMTLNVIHLSFSSLKD